MVRPKPARPLSCGQTYGPGQAPRSRLTDSQPWLTSPPSGQCPARTTHAHPGIAEQFRRFRRPHCRARFRQVPSRPILLCDGIERRLHALRCQCPAPTCPTGLQCCAADPTELGTLPALHEAMSRQAVARRRFDHWRRLLLLSPVGYRTASPGLWASVLFTAAQASLCRHHEPAIAACAPSLRSVTPLRCHLGATFDACHGCLSSRSMQFVVALALPKEHATTDHPNTTFTGIVKGFGCRPMATGRLAPGPASESLQGRNPRVVGGRGRRECYGDFAVVGWWPDRGERRWAVSAGLAMGRGRGVRLRWAPRSACDRGSMSRAAYRCGQAPSQPADDRRQ